MARAGASATRACQGRIVRSDKLRRASEDLATFLTAVEDHLAEFLADIYLSPAASMIMPADNEPNRDGWSGPR